MDRPKSVMGVIRGVCDGGRQGSIDSPCQLSSKSKFWHLQNLLPQGNRLILDVSVRYRAD